MAVGLRLTSCLPPSLFDRTNILDRRHVLKKRDELREFRVRRVAYEGRDSDVVAVVSL